MTLGEYKPLLVTQENLNNPDTFIVLGGNMRLRVYRELNWSRAWVSIVDAPDEQSKLRYALSDNDNAGQYDQQAVAELSMVFEPAELKDFAINLGEAHDLSRILAKFGPGGDDEMRTITFKLHKDVMHRLEDHLASLDKNRHLAIEKWLNNL